MRFGGIVAQLALLAACAHDASPDASRVGGVAARPVASARTAIDAIARDAGAPNAAAPALQLEAVAIRDGSLTFAETVDGKLFLVGDTFVRALGDHGELVSDDGAWMEGLPGTSPRVNESVTYVTLIDGKLPRDFYAQVLSAMFGTLGRTEVYRYDANAAAGAPRFVSVPNRSGILEWAWAGFSRWTNDRVLGLRTWSASDPGGGWGPMDPRWAPYHRRANAEIARKGAPRLEVVSGAKSPDDLPRIPANTELRGFVGFPSGHAFGLVAEPAHTKDSAARMRLVAWRPGERDPQTLEIPGRTNEHASLETYVAGADDVFVWSNDAVELGESPPKGTPLAARYHAGTWSTLDLPPHSGALVSLALGPGDRLHAVLQEDNTNWRERVGQLYVQNAGKWSRVSLPPVTFPSRTKPHAAFESVDLRLVVEPPETNPAPAPTTMRAKRVVVRGDDVLVVATAESAGVDPPSAFYRVVHGTSATSSPPVVLPSNLELDLVKAEREGWVERPMDRVQECKGRARPFVVAVAESASLSDAAAIAAKISTEDELDRNRRVDVKTKANGAFGPDEQPLRFFEAPVAGKPTRVAMLDPWGEPRPPSRARIAAMFGAMRKVVPTATPKIYCRWVTPTRELVP